jgi:acid phosphatase type 7
VEARRLGGHLVGESMMRRSEKMRAASRLLLSHPIVCLLAALAAGVVLGVLGPIKVVHAADVTVEGENFANRPAGTVIVTDSTRGYSGNRALKFTANVTASHTVSCSQVCDVVLRARGGQSGGSTKLTVNGVARDITSSALANYTFENLPAGTDLSLTAGNVATGRNAFLDMATLPADGGTDPGGTDPGGTDPVFVGAGDIASCARTGDEATAKLLDDIVEGAPSTTTVFTTGDNAYESGTASEYKNCYAPSWGRPTIKEITRPTVGNHEYYASGNASGYFGYFGAAAVSYDASTKGYYSYNFGQWHMVALNSMCEKVGGCGATSPMVAWLKQDLAANPRTCTLAYFHHPLFSSGSMSGGNSKMKPSWEALYAARADVVLNGHVHNYERFAPQTPSGKADLAQGIREFVVGRGGYSLNTFKSTVANSQVRNANSYGVLKLTLHPSSYDWQFVTAPGGTVADSGSGSCRS